MEREMLGEGWGDRKMRENWEVILELYPSGNVS